MDCHCKWFGVKNIPWKESLIIYLVGKSFWIFALTTKILGTSEIFVKLIKNDANERYIFKNWYNLKLHLYYLHVKYIDAGSFVFLEIKYTKYTTMIAVLQPLEKGYLLYVVTSVLSNVTYMLSLWKTDVLKFSKTLMELINFLIEQIFPAKVYTIVCILKSCMIAIILVAIYFFYSFFWWSPIGCPIY